MKIINIYDKVINEDGLVDNHYLNEDIQYDPIHLNNNISELFLDTLESRNIINDKNIYINTDYHNKNFTKHRKFNTYII